MMTVAALTLSMGAVSSEALAQSVGEKPIVSQAEIKDRIKKIVEKYDLEEYMFDYAFYQLENADNFSTFDISKLVLQPNAIEKMFGYLLLNPNSRFKTQFLAAIKADKEFTDDWAEDLVVLAVDYDIALEIKREAGNVTTASLMARWMKQSKAA